MDILVLNEGSLATYLSTDFVVGKTCCREKRNFLATSDGVHEINSRDTSLDHLLRIFTLIRVDGLALKEYEYSEVLL